MNYVLDDKEYEVKIVRKNNKNTYVRVKNNNTILVTTSYFTTKKQIENLLNQNLKFLRNALQKQERKKRDSDKLLYMGKTYHITISKLMDDVNFIGSQVFTPSKIYLDKWYLKMAKKYFQEHYELIYNKFEENIPFYKLKFRNMKTRWGVCNKKSETITLNTKLLEYDLVCLDYVIIHELCHLLEFNHSKNFWNVVEKYCPDYKTIKKILKD